MLAAIHFHEHTCTHTHTHIPERRFIHTHIHTCTMTYMYTFSVMFHCCNQFVTLNSYMYTNRLNLFYDNCHCVSLACPEGEEDVQEITQRLSAVSHAQEVCHDYTIHVNINFVFPFMNDLQAFLVEFSRSKISGLLGFTIDQDGAVVKVDGLARTTGLQKGARVLQVEDRLVSCHPHNDIIALLQDRTRHYVKTFVIPPLPKLNR